jgi:hypothetical protein
VWITVVATGFSDTPVRRRESSLLREPAGEPRVSRAPRTGRADMSVDVPEFIPRF